MDQSKPLSVQLVIANIFILTIILLLPLLPLLNVFDLSYGELIRLCLIVFGLVYLYLKQLRCDHHDLLDGNSALLVLTGLSYVYILAQFGPLERSGGALVQGSTWFILLIVVVLLGFLGVATQRGLKFSLVGLLHRDSKNKKQTLYVMDRILVYVALITFLLSIFTIFFGQVKADVSWLRVLQIPAFVLSYFLVTKFIILKQDSEIFSKLRHLWKFIIGVFFIVIVLNAGKIIWLYTTYSDASELLKQGKLDDSFDTYLKVSKCNAYLNIPLFLEKNIQDDLVNQLYPMSLDANRKYLLSLFYLEQKNWRQAAQQLEEIFKQETTVAQDLSNSMPFYQNLTSALFNLQDWPALKQVSETAFKRFPENLSMRIKYGIALIKEKDPQDLVAIIDAGQHSLGLDHLRNLSDDFSLVQDLLSPGFKDYFGVLSLYDVKWLLEKMGYHVYHPNEKIGLTGLQTPGLIYARSAGFGVDSGLFRLGDREIRGNRGYNFFVVNPLSGGLEKEETFDTNMGGRNEKLVNFIDQIQTGRIVAAIVADDASYSLNEMAVKALRTIGAQEDLRGHYRWAHLIIGVKGAQPGHVIERMSDRKVEAYLLKANIEYRDIQDLQQKLREVAKQEQRVAVFISGTAPFDTVMVVKP